MLAKLSKPILHQPVPRSRLFERLDERNRHPITWICGPAGAGKSSLVAGYLDARGASTRWMHLDAGDQDPATFFYFLRESVPASARGAIPVLTPEHALNLAGFSHQFFRALFAAQSADTILVLDNVQDAMCEDLCQVLKEGLVELPSTHAVILISRERLPPVLVRYRLSGTLHVIDWDDLKLTEEEAVALAGSLGVDDLRARSLRAQVDGWVAGLILLASSAVGRVVDRLSYEDLFDYLAGEVYDRADAHEREILLAACVFSEFSEDMITEVSGIENAPAILERVYRTQFFLSRSEGGEGAYRLHALFRAFLLRRLSSDKAVAKVRALRRRASQSLAKRGRHEEAIDLLLFQNDYERAIVHVRKLAVTLVKYGRGSVLLAWLSRLPEKLVAADPWLIYWRASAVLWMNPREAYRLFGSAYHSFSMVGETGGRLAAAVGALDSVEFALADFQDKDKWIDPVASLLVETTSSGELETRLRGWCAFLLSALDRRPDHPLLPTAVAVLVASLDEGPLDLDLRVLILSVLASYSFIAVDDEIGGRALREFSRCYGIDACSPSTLCGWFLWAGWYCFGRADWSGALENMARAAGLARSAKLVNQQRAAEACAALMLVFTGNDTQAEAELNRLTATVEPHEHNVRRLLAKGKAFIHVRRGSPKRAMECIEASISSVDAIGVLDVCGCTRIDMAEIAAIGGHVERAKVLVAQAAIYLTHDVQRYLDAALLAVRLYVDSLSGRSPRQEEIFECMELLLQPGRRGSFIVVRSAAAFVCSAAVDYGIHAQLAHDLIVTERLSPPHHASHRWPWYMTVHALGRFDVQLGAGSALGRARSPHKVLELLKVLVVAGRRTSYAAAISDALWPDADGATASVSLHTNLHRLRRYLMNDRVVRLKDGRIWLDGEFAWTDVGAFEHVADRLLSLSRGLDSDQQEMARAALSLYVGPLIPEDDHPLILAARDRIRSKFIKLAVRLSDALIAGGDHDSAVSVMQRCTELEPGHQYLVARLGRLVDAAAHSKRIAMDKRVGPKSSDGTDA